MTRLEYKNVIHLFTIVNNRQGSPPPLSIHVFRPAVRVSGAERRDPGRSKQASGFVWIPKLLNDGRKFPEGVEEKGGGYAMVHTMKSIYWFTSGLDNQRAERDHC
jgi:hypothetical protein